MFVVRSVKPRINPVQERICRHFRGCDHEGRYLSLDDFVDKKWFDDDSHQHLFAYLMSQHHSFSKTFAIMNGFDAEKAADYYKKLTRAEESRKSCSFAAPRRSPI